MKEQYASKYLLNATFRYIYIYIYSHNNSKPDMITHLGSIKNKTNKHDIYSRPDQMFAGAPVLV